MTSRHLEKEHTVVDKNRDGTLFRHLHPIILQCLLVQRSRIVPARNHDRDVGASRCRFLGELDSLLGAAGAGTSDDRHMCEGRTVRGVEDTSDGAYGLLSLVVCEVVCLAHGTTNHDPHPRSRNTKHMCLQSGDVFKMQDSGTSAIMCINTHRVPQCLDERK